MCNVEHVAISKNNPGVWRSGRVCRSVIVFDSYGAAIEPLQGTFRGD